MGFAEVCVNSPAGYDRTFSYAIPPHLSVRVGQAVWVPFGEKLLQGIVLELAEYPQVEETRDIAGIIEPGLIISPERVALASWISRYYLSPLFAAVALMLPPGFERRALTYFSINPDALHADPASMTDEQRQALALIEGSVTISLRQLEKALGKQFGFEYAEAFHYRGPREKVSGYAGDVEEYSRKNAVPLR